MPILTGTDTNGVFATANNQIYITALGDTVSDTGNAFVNNGFDNVTYIINGAVYGDSFGVRGMSTPQDFMLTLVQLAQSGDLTTASG